MKGLTALERRILLAASGMTPAIKFNGAADRELTAAAQRLLADGRLRCGGYVRGSVIYLSTPDGELALKLDAAARGISL